MPKKTPAAPKTKQRPSGVKVRETRKLKAAPAKISRWSRSKGERPVRVYRLPSVWSLIKACAGLLWQHKKLFIGIAAIYGVLTLILVQGLARGTDIGQLKDQFQQLLGGSWSTLGSSLAIFAVLVGSAGNGSSETAGAYQLILSVLVSLAVIWALRQVLAGSNIRIRDAYYKGMYPFVPFILVLTVIGLQLIPLGIGLTFYNLVTLNGIAVTVLEQVLWLLQLIVLGGVSFYLLSSSLFALYIVTLPDMTPFRALRSARELVRYRRLTVLRKLAALPVALLLLAVLIMLPIIIWLTPLAQWMFFLLTTFSVVAIHTYMYLLYRELLNE